MCITPLLLTDILSDNQTAKQSSLVAVGLSAGYETMVSKWLMLQILWLASLNIHWGYLNYTGLCISCNALWNHATEENSNFPSVTDSPLYSPNSRQLLGLCKETVKQSLSGIRHSTPYSILKKCVFIESGSRLCAKTTQGQKFWPWNRWKARQHAPISNILEVLFFHDASDRHNTDHENNSRIDKWKNLNAAVQRLL